MAHILRLNNTETRDTVVALDDGMFRFDRISRTKSRRFSRNAVIGGFLTIPLGKNAKEITVRGRYIPAGIYSTAEGRDGLSWYQRLLNIEAVEEQEIILDFINIQEGRYLFHRFTHDADRYLRMYADSFQDSPTKDLGMAPLEITWTMDFIEVLADAEVSTPPRLSAQQLANIFGQF